MTVSGRDKRLLIQNEVKALGIVDRDVPKGWRDTTYDATIGEIIDRNGPWSGSVYPLKPRGIVWVMSREMFTLPDHVSGITTLRTSWTKKGILTLTVGIVDPGYEGPLSTAIINFSGHKFNVEVGDTFFRTAFFVHNDSSGTGRKVDRNTYRSELIQDVSSFSESFLTVDTLAEEIAPKIIGMPKWGLMAAVVGVIGATLLALYALIVPPLFGLTGEIFRTDAVQKQLLDKDIELENAQESLRTQNEALVRRIEELERRAILALPPPKETK